MLTSAGSKVCLPARAARASRDAAAASWSNSALTFLNVTCLDAPLVAVSWQWVFAHTFHAPLPFAARGVLFLSAWLIYLADRLADSFTVPAQGELALRQSFCRRHRWLIAGVIACIAPVDALWAWHALDPGTEWRGAIVGAGIAIYLGINHLAPFIWRKAPLKEVTIGFFFAAGVLSAIEWNSASFDASALLFAALCALNCLSISFWERALDASQGRVSFAIAWPSLARLPQVAAWLLAMAAVPIIVQAESRPLGLCVAGSAILLALLHRSERWTRDERVALADLVLLTPILFWILAL